LLFLSPFALAGGGLSLFREDPARALFEFSETRNYASGTVSAQIYADLLVSFTHQQRVTGLKNQQFYFGHLLAWKAAGLPTET
jgi:hypothetical protein